MNYWSMQNAVRRLALPDRRRGGRSSRSRRAAGFFYKWDEQTQQFAHVSGVLVITPDGRLSRYFYGIEYSPKELRLALVEVGPGPHRIARSTSCCCIATTTTRERAGMARS